MDENHHHYYLSLLVHFISGTFPGEINSFLNLKNGNLNSFSLSSTECLVQGKTSERCNSSCYRGQNREIARPMTRKIQRLVFSRKQATTVKQAVGLTLPTVNFSPC